MRKAWKLVSVFVLFFLVMTTIVVYSRVGSATTQATMTTQAANAGLNMFRCVKCQHPLHVVTHPATGTTTGASDDYLLAVAAASTNDVWAVGDAYSYTTTIDKNLVEHWNGQQWSIVASPAPGIGSDLFGVATDATTDVWAVGVYFPTTTALGQTLIEHWNGTAWVVVPSPNVGNGYNSLNSVTALSTNNVWAVGQSILGSVTSALIEHWNGTSWSIVIGPDPGTIITDLSSITAVSANSIWAVGAYSSKSNNSTDLNTLVEYWNGTRWEVVPSPISSTYENYFFAVAAIARDNIFSAGGFDEHWDGGTWNTTDSPANFFAFGLTRVPGTTKAWFVGTGPSSSSGTATVYWNGTQWEVVSNPNPAVPGELNGVAAISANDVWAVGEYYDASGNASTVALHWDGGAWSVVSSPNP